RKCERTPPPSSRRISSPMAFGACPSASSSLTTPALSILSSLSSAMNTESNRPSANPQWRAIAARILRSLIRMVRSVRPSVRSASAVARISSISAISELPPRMAVSHLDLVREHVAHTARWRGVELGLSRHGGRAVTHEQVLAGWPSLPSTAGSRASAPGPTRGSGRSGALLLGQRHDQLRFTRYLEEVLVADDRGDQRRLAAVLTGNAADRADHAVEARVHLLKPQPGRSAKDDTDQPAGVDLVLRHDDLLDAVPVEINGEWSGLELE